MPNAPALAARSTPRPTVVGSVGFENTVSAGRSVDKPPCPVIASPSRKNRNGGGPHVQGQDVPVAVVDVDSHLTEPPDLWTERLPAKGPMSHRESSRIRPLASNAGASAMPRRCREHRKRHHELPGPARRPVRLRILGGHLDATFSCQLEHRYPSHHVGRVPAVPGSTFCLGGERLRFRAVPTGSNGLAVAYRRRAGTLPGLVATTRVLSSADLLHVLVRARLASSDPRLCGQRDA
jgi:hypothetical protein